MSLGAANHRTHLSYLRVFLGIISSWFIFSQASFAQEDNAELVQLLKKKKELQSKVNNLQRDITDADKFFKETRSGDFDRDGKISKNCNFCQLKKSAEGQTTTGTRAIQLTSACHFDLLTRANYRDKTELDLSGSGFVEDSTFGELGINDYSSSSCWLVHEAFLRDEREGVSYGSLSSRCYEKIHDRCEPAQKDFIRKSGKREIKMVEAELDEINGKIRGLSCETCDALADADLTKKNTSIASLLGGGSLYASGAYGIPTEASAKGGIAGIAQAGLPYAALLTNALLTNKALNVWGNGLTDYYNQGLALGIPGYAPSFPAFVGSPLGIGSSLGIGLGGPFGNLGNSLGLQLALGNNGFNPHIGGSIYGNPFMQNPLLNIGLFPSNPFMGPFGQLGGPWGSTMPNYQHMLMMQQQQQYQQQMMAYQMQIQMQQAYRQQSMMQAYQQLQYAQTGMSQLHYQYQNQSQYFSQLYYSAYQQYMMSSMYGIGGIGIGGYAGNNGYGNGFGIQGYLPLQQLRSPMGSYPFGGYSSGWYPNSSPGYYPSFPQGPGQGRYPAGGPIGSPCINPHAPCPTRPF